jgi:signal transduction histidine kinase
VILNLIMNAADAILEANRARGREKGSITVSTRLEADDVVVRVSDDGTGIPEKIRDRIFDYFFTTKEVGKGTGQGLAIAHSVIVKKHGGSIEFESEVGKGTTFIVRLPLSGRVPDRAEGIAGSR